MIDMRMADGPGTSTPSKLATILSLFLDGRSLNRFEAESYHDHCLHSTVSQLQSLGLRIERVWEEVPCVGGRSRTRVKRYWLDPAPENRTFAAELLRVLMRGASDGQAEALAQ